MPPDDKEESQPNQMLIESLGCNLTQWPQTKQNTSSAWFYGLFHLHLSAFGTSECVTPIERLISPFLEPSF